MTANYQVNHASPKVNNNKTNEDDDHRYLHTTDILDVQILNTEGSLNVADYESENVRYDVNQILIKSDKTENETVDDVDSVFNASIPNDECVSEWSGAADYEDTEFNFQHLEGIQMNNEEQF